MATVIKKIQAGNLFLRILGKVPDPNPKRRNTRLNPTRQAQQFYNDKLSYRELMLWIAANFGENDWVLTLTYTDEFLPSSKKEAGEFLGRKYFRKIRSVRKKRGQELKYIYVTEGWHGKSQNDFIGDDGDLEDVRIHHHIIINGVSPGDIEEFKSMWPGGGYVKVEPLDIHYYEALARYLTKEAREYGRSKVGERTWRRSMNLTKYQVEYEEVQDGLTLVPPDGAVDYVSFHVKNPYGFSDCVGDMYLLFKKPPNPHYSYTDGPRKKKPPK